MCNETYRPSVVTFRLNPLLNRTQDHFVILPVPTRRLSRYLTSSKNRHSFNPNDVGIRAGLFLHARSVLAQLNTLPILCSLQKMRKPQRHTLPTTLGKYLKFRTKDKCYLYSYLSLFRTEVAKFLIVTMNVLK